MLYCGKMNNFLVHKENQIFMRSKLLIYWNLYTILKLIGQLFQKHQNLVILPSEKFHNGCQNVSKQQFFANFMYKNESKGESTRYFCHDFLLSYTSKRSDQYIEDFRFLKINQEIFSL